MPGLYMYIHILRPGCISRKIVGKKYFPPPKKKLLGREPMFTRADICVSLSSNNGEVEPTEDTEYPRIHFA